MMPSMSMQRLFLSLLAAPLLLTAQKVEIQVDAAQRMGPLTPIWRYYGYDEPNYTSMKDGQKLLTELAAMHSGPVYVRMHNLLTTGDGTPALKWGSTNAYTEDAQGNPRYDWTIIDRIFDTLIQRKMKPLVEIGFMPKALSTKPEPYQHKWAANQPYSRIEAGWAYPPRDYAKWAELVRQWVLHSVERYGRKEVETWMWEVWNEPNIMYWQGTPEEYQKLYDYSVDAVKRALPTAKVGGPHSTGPGSARSEEYLHLFLTHVVEGTNYATGKKGSPIDFLAFHAKGRPRFIEGRVQMGSEYQLRDLDHGFATVASFPTLKHLPVIIGESDPEGCAACSASSYPQNAYRNGTVYSSYTAATFARKFDLAARHGANLQGAVTWAFEFENQPYFDGFRDLATNGIDKPVLNIFRMFGRMGGDRVAARSSGALELDAMVDKGVKGAADIAALASRQARRASIMVWNYHDDDLPAAAANVALTVRGLPAGAVRLRHLRVDATHSNSYEVWKKMGSPQQPSPAQYAELERSGRLQELAPVETVKTSLGAAVVHFELPRQGVSLLEFEW